MNKAEIIDEIAKILNTKKEAQETSGIETVYWLQDFDSVLREVLATTKNVFLNSNEYVKYFSEVPDRNQRFAQQFRIDFPGLPQQHFQIIGQGFWF